MIYGFTDMFLPFDTRTTNNAGSSGAPLRQSMPCKGWKRVIKDGSWWRDHFVGPYKHVQIRSHMKPCIPTLLLHHRDINMIQLFVLDIPWYSYNTRIICKFLLVVFFQYLSVIFRNCSKSRALPWDAQVANSKGLSPAQVVLKWHLQRGLTPVAKTTSTRRLKENLSSKESPDLTASEMDVLASLDRQSSCDFTGFTSPDRIAWAKRDRKEALKGACAWILYSMWTC